MKNNKEGNNINISGSNNSIGSVNQSIGKVTGKGEEDGGEVDKEMVMRHLQKNELLPALSIILANGSVRAKELSVGLIRRKNAIEESLLSGVIDYDTYSLEINKITAAIVQLVR